MLKGKRVEIFASYQPRAFDAGSSILAVTREESVNGVLLHRNYSLDLVEGAYTELTLAAHKYTGGAR